MFTQVITTPVRNLSSSGIKNTENVRYQLSPEELIQDTLRLGEGVLSDSGALVIRTGELRVVPQKTSLSSETRLLKQRFIGMMSTSLLTRSILTLSTVRYQRISKVYLNYGLEIAMHVPIRVTVLRCVSSMKSHATTCLHITCSFVLTMKSLKIFHLTGM